MKHGHYESKDKIRIHGLSVPAIIGVSPQEHHSKQKLVVDLVISTDFTTCAESDNIEHTIDYIKLRNFILEFAAKSQFHLIETFADKMAEGLLQEFKIEHLQLTVTKKPFDMPDVTNVSVTIERVKL